MSAQTVTKKRKSIGDATVTTKKAKTTKTAKLVEKPAKAVEKPSKAANKPAPIKSALKKPQDEIAPKKTAAPKDEVALKKTSAPTQATKTKVPKKSQDKKTAPAEPTQAPIASAVSDTEEGGAELTEDQTAALLAGFSDSEEDASDAEDNDGIETSKLPQAPRTVEIQKRIKQAVAANPETAPGVLYLGRIPHGFYEHQMRAYFSQFGEITHIRLARNRKTGKSQHYGFMEFASAAVAEIVAKTMDKYLLFGHLLQVRMVPTEQVSEGLWRGGERRRKPAPRNRLEGARLKRGMVREDWEKRVEREGERRKEKAEKLRELGYEFEMPKLRSASDVPAGSKLVGSGGDVEVDEKDVDEEEKVLAIEPSVEEPKTVVSRTVQSEPNGVKVTEVKTTTKKRAAGEAKAKKTKAKV